MQGVEFDWERSLRTGLPEAVLCEGKTTEQIVAILAQANDRQASLLLTRLSLECAEHCASQFSNLVVHTQSNTAVLNNGITPPEPSKCLIITAGSSDMPVALEAKQTLLFNGVDVTVIPDCGVAGLWR